MKHRAATIGTFDGFHLGHAHLVDFLRHQAVARGLEPLIVTFDRHPLASIDPDRVPPLLMDRDCLDHRLRDCGIDSLVLTFDRDTAALTAAGFIDMLHRDHGVDLIVMGYDNSMGCDRLSGIEQYRAAARSAGVDIVPYQPYSLDDGTVPSSSLLRQLLSQGDTMEFRRIAGHPFTIRGTVEHGLRNGHRLGFPTLNIAVDSSLAIPATGVYSGRIDIDGISHLAVINIGHNPTIAHGNPLTIEAHAIDTDLGDRYGHTATLTFISRLRGERRFDSLDSLRAAIAADIAAARHAIVNP